MNRFLKYLLILLALIAVAVFVYSYKNDGLLSKPLSPKKTVKFEVDDLELEVFYNRPSKRNRDIFGGLVPYNEVWRTGANEATTFETNKPLTINGDSLPAGKYTLWTIPNDSTWDVIFNSKMYAWGVTETMEAMRNSKYDVIKTRIPTETLKNFVEQFTIAFDNSTDNLSLTMAWDLTKVVIPLK